MLVAAFCAGKRDSDVPRLVNHKLHSLPVKAVPGQSAESAVFFMSPLKEENGDFVGHDACLAEAV